MSPEHVPWVAAGAMLVAAAALLVLVLTWHRRRLDRPGRGESVGRPDRTAPAQTGPTGQWDDAMDQVTRRIETRVDAKIAELRRLLADADKRIAHLRRLTPPGPPASAESPGANRPDLTARQQEIIRLDSQGMDAVRIARRMEMDVGEVHLVLNLHRQQAQAPRPAEH